jgi:hypothetical protein
MRSSDTKLPIIESKKKKDRIIGELRMICYFQHAGRPQFH